MIETSIYDFITQVAAESGLDCERLAALTALNTKLAARISPLNAPQGREFPRVVYGVVDGNADVCFDGSPLIPELSFGFECQSVVYDDAAEIAGLLIALLNGFQGNMTGTNVRGCFIEDEFDEFEPVKHADEETVKARTVKFKFYVRR